MFWEDILKNAKVTGSSKGTTLSSNRIKIKRPERCKEKLLQYCINAVRLEKPNVYEIDTIYAGEYDTYFRMDWEELPEETACKVLKLIDEHFILYPETLEGVFLGFYKPEGRFNIDEYIFEREIKEDADGGYKNRIDITYSLRSKEGALVWYISCTLYKKSSSLSDRELDWRK